VKARLLSSIFGDAVPASRAFQLLPVEVVQHRGPAGCKTRTHRARPAGPRRFGPACQSLRQSGPALCAAAVRLALRSVTLGPQFGQPLKQPAGFGARYSIPASVAISRETPVGTKFSAVAKDNPLPSATAACGTNQRALGQIAGRKGGKRPCRAGSSAAPQIGHPLPRQDQAATANRQDTRTVPCRFGRTAGPATRFRL